MLEFWWALQDLNLGPIDYESTALTAELRARKGLLAIPRLRFYRQAPHQQTGGDVGLWLTLIEFQRVCICACAHK